MEYHHGLTRDIPPEFGGTVQGPNRNDVLSGRGGRINSHPGNMYFRDLVHKYKFRYLANDTTKLDKRKIADMIVRTVRNLDPPGRFLKEVPKTTYYLDIGDEKARKKAGQAMREKSQTTRKINAEEKEHQKKRLHHNPHHCQPPPPRTSIFNPTTGTTDFPSPKMYMNHGPPKYPPGSDHLIPTYGASTFPPISPPASIASTSIASTSIASNNSTTAEPSSFTHRPSTQNLHPYQSPQSPNPDTSVYQQYTQ